MVFLRFLISRSMKLTKVLLQVFHSHMGQSLIEQNHLISHVIKTTVSLIKMERVELKKNLALCV